MLAHAESPSFEEAQTNLSDILRPHVATIDRDLILFRYEKKDPERFNPTSVQDLVKRAYPWSKRFFDVNIIANPDAGGPGLYTSTDPTATAIWGMTDPGLFVFSLKKHTNILIGDATEVSDQDKSQLDEIYRKMNCGENKFQADMGKDFSVVITRFRNANNSDCRRLVISVFEKMQISAITYSFYSSPLMYCRATGTAVNIVWPDAIELEHINYYSEGKSIIGDSRMTAFVKMLFDEGKSYLFAQMSMANDELRLKLREDFGFFDGIQDLSKDAYEVWKNQHILRCGPKWSTERPDLRSVLSLNALITNCMICLRERHKLTRAESSFTKTPTQKMQRLNLILPK